MPTASAYELGAARYRQGVVRCRARERVSQALLSPANGVMMRERMRTERVLHVEPEQSKRTSQGCMPGSATRQMPGQCVVVLSLYVRVGVDTATE